MCNGAQKNMQWIRIRRVKPDFNKNIPCIFLLYNLRIFPIDSWKGCAWPYPSFISINLISVKTVYYKSLFKGYQHRHTMRCRLKRVFLFHNQMYIYFIHFSLFQKIDIWCENNNINNINHIGLTNSLWHTSCKKGWPEIIQQQKRD